MNHPHPSRAGTRFGRVKLELLQSISNMSPDMKFFIIFFNDLPLPMPARNMQLAEKDVQRAYLEWMARFPAIGGTEPGPALLLALQLKPDVIYFLTDGRFDGSVVRDVTEANVDQVRINTICIGNTSGEKLLQEIAMRNGGQYVFVP